MKKKLLSYIQIKIYGLWIDKVIDLNTDLKKYIRDNHDLTWNSME